MRDRALIGVLVYAFARIGAAVAMNVEDVFHQHRRLWVRLHEKGGKEHTMPAHHNLDEYLSAYIEGAGIGGDGKGPLFRTVRGRSQVLQRLRLRKHNAWHMVQRRAKGAGIATHISNHTFRASGITAYLKNGASSSTLKPWRLIHRPTTCPWRIDVHAAIGSSNSPPQCFSQV